MFRRPADLPFPLNQFNHYWFKADVYEAEMGAEGRVPGGEGQSVGHIQELKLLIILLNQIISAPHALLSLITMKIASTK